MNCDLAQQNIALAVYGELADATTHQLEQHLAQCEACRAELESVQALYKAMQLYPVEEPSANLLASARLRLEEALDAVPRSSLLVRLSQAVSHSFARLVAAPGLTLGLLALGLCAGGYAGYRVGHQAAAQAVPQAGFAVSRALPELDEEAAQIGNVNSIVREPGSEDVEVRYTRIVPVSVHGSVDDPAIRQLLLAGAENRVNPAVSDDCLDLLATACQAGHQCDGGPVRTALMVALRYDKSSGVRLKALEGLAQYIAEDTRVRDAVLEAVMNDRDSKVRSAAIGLLTPVEADSSVREVLHTVAVQDDNPQIRTVSQQVLSQMPQVQ